MTIFCTTVIATIGRATLARAVNSVLEQAFSAESIEVIVVNDSGAPLDVQVWQADPRVTIIDTNRRERSVARNAGATMARGRYLHFLDDDDWLLPASMQTFYTLAQKNTEAHWLYSASQLVSRHGEALLMLDHQLQGNCFAQVMAGEWIPLQSSLISREQFFAVGAFHTLTHASEDVDLCRRIALRGDIVGSAEPVAAIERGEEGSSTDLTQHTTHSRRAREEILNQTGVFARLQASAKDGFWHGRIVRLYLTSMVQNLQSPNATQFVSRAVRLLVALGYALRFWFSAEFWRAILKKYQSPTFARGAQAAASNL